MHSDEAPSRQLTLTLPPGPAADLLAEAAADWGGEWRVEGNGYLLLLPVTAGLRRGFSAVRMAILEDGDGSRVEIASVENHLEINRGAAGVLAFGAMGSVVAVLWPFFPDLLRLAPIAAVLAVVAWLLVAGRLRTVGLEEFLDAVEAVAEATDPSLPA